MALFGRRANQQSTKPEVPPELRPYYDGTSRGTRLRHAVGRLAPLIIAIVLSGAIISGAVWWRDNHKNSSTSANTATSKPKPNNQVAQNKTQSSSSGSAASSSQSPTLFGAPPTQPSPTSAAPQTSSASTSTPSATSTSSSQSGAATTSIIPNTGPDASSLVAAFSATVIGTTLYYLRQLRRLRN